VFHLSDTCVTDAKLGELRLQQYRCEALPRNFCSSLLAATRRLTICTIRFAAATATTVHTDTRGELLIQWSDAQAAQLCVAPSGLREIAVEVPRVKWADIGGQNEVRTLEVKKVNLFD
jgi:SpoVK/Ycf46/Vps4 family AAA+-type ATPase